MIKSKVEKNKQDEGAEGTGLHLLESGEIAMGSVTLFLKNAACVTINGNDREGRYFETYCILDYGTEGIISIRQFEKQSKGPGNLSHKAKLMLSDLPELRFDEVHKRPVMSKKALEAILPQINKSVHVS